MVFENTPEDLKKAFKSYNVKHEFKPGDIIRWKEGLKNKRSEGPFVVMEVLDPPVVDGSDASGSGFPYFREKLDLVCGTVIDDDFLLYHMDSSRMEPLY